MRGRGLKARVERALSPLVGLPLWSAGRALDLEWFHFGPKRNVPCEKWVGDRFVLGRKKVGSHALHVQCAWRVRGPGRILVASGDLYSAADDPDETPRGFDWRPQGANLRDRRTKAFFARVLRSSLVVQTVESDEVGSLRISTRGGFMLDVFPDASRPDEHWRFFEPSREEKHFVLSGRGAEWA